MPKLWRMWAALARAGGGAGGAPPPPAALADLPELLHLGLELGDRLLEIQVGAHRAFSNENARLGRAARTLARVRGPSQGEAGWGTNTGESRRARRALGTATG